MKKMYTIKDAKSESFNPPFFNHTHGEAERNFQELVNDNSSFVSKYPEDYDLYYLGTYDERTGKFDPLETPEHVVKAVQLARPKSNLAQV